MYFFFLVVGRRLTSDPDVLWLRMGPRYCGCVWAHCTVAAYGPTVLWLRMGLLYQPQMVNKCGAMVNSYITGRANTNCMGSISFPLCPSTALHGQSWDWTWVSSVTSWQQPGQMSVTVHVIINIWFRFIYRYIKLLVSWYFIFSVQFVYIKKVLLPTNCTTNFTHPQILETTATCVCCLLQLYSGSTLVQKIYMDLKFNFVSSKW